MNKTNGRKSEMRRLKAALVYKGISQTKIAKELGMKLQSVNQVLNGRRYSERVVAHIKEALKRGAARRPSQPGHGCPEDFLQKAQAI